MHPLFDGGEGGIRTHGPFDRSTVFKTVALSRSATSPLAEIISDSARFAHQSFLCPPFTLSRTPFTKVQRAEMFFSCMSD